MNSYILTLIVVSICGLITLSCFVILVVMLIKDKIDEIRALKEMRSWPSPNFEILIYPDGFAPEYTFEEAQEIYLLGSIKRPADNDCVNEYNSYQNHWW